jgi:hypothetical protein
MATKKPTKSAPEVNPAMIAGAVIGLVVVVVAIAYFTLFRGPKADTSPQVQVKNQQMSNDPVLMGKAGDGK